MGIGPERAKILIEAGLKTINQLHMKKYISMLPEETKTFISLKPAITIPRAEITAIEPYLLKIAENIGAEAIITGSYRRKKPNSSDIDLMLISDDRDIIEKFLAAAKNNEAKYSIHPYSKGSDKMSLIIVKKPTAYKLDVFRTNQEEKIPMLLYSTGSKEFNVAMRGKAKKLGYLLNQKGLFKSGKRVSDLNTEKDYFDILEMPYKDPEERV
jgi:DNA polymerase/3'-5' exonuclease PolX